MLLNSSTPEKRHVKAYRSDGFSMSLIRPASVEIASSWRALNIWFHDWKP